MKNIAIALFSLVLSCSCFAQEDFSWSGIWQDVNNPLNLFTIHENGDQVVFVVLVHVDNGEALKAAYMGKKGAEFLNKLSPLPESIFNQVVLRINSPTEGVVYPHTLANVPFTFIKKIF